MPNGSNTVIGADIGGSAAWVRGPEPSCAQVQKGEGNETELELFERFARALIHSVRGDLSVIQNELSFLSALHGEENVRSSLGRCHSIAAVLSHLSHARVPAALEAIPVTEIVPGLPPGGSFKDWRVRGERGALAFALVVLPELLRARCSGADVSWCVLRIEVGYVPSATGSFHSLSSFVSAEIGETGVVRAVVADLVLRHLGYAAHVEASASGAALLLRGSGIERIGRGEA